MILPINLSRHSHNLHNIAHKNGPINLQETDNSNNIAKVSLENLKANYMVSFKGYSQSEKSDESCFGELKQYTYFFREPKTDEVVQDYIRDVFKEGEINVVSGACSIGEEAKSYAMMLDDLGERLHVYGFDVSESAIRLAKNCPEAKIIMGTIRKDEIGKYVDPGRESYIGKYAHGITKYQRKCKKKFFKYFERKPCRKIEPETRNSDIIYVYNPKEGKHLECEFKKWNVLDLENAYPSNSVNVLLYRNALYHTLDKKPGEGKEKEEEIKRTMNSIASQMNKVLKDRGLVVFGEIEMDHLTFDKDIISDCMKQNGFINYEKKGETYSNIWVKKPTDGAKV